MRAYKLEVSFYSPLILYDLITLDALVAYALAVKYNNRKGFFCNPQAVKQDNNIIKHELQHLITHHTPLYPIIMASYIQPVLKIEYLDSWKKRFESKYAGLADFGKARRRVDTSSGKYRSYNMPLPAVVVQKAFFVFIGKSDVADMINDYIVGIGKKRNQGFGWIRDMKLSNADYTCFDIARMRPVPEEIAKKHDIKGMLKYCAWQSPYWLRDNMCKCIVPAEPGRGER